MTTAITEYERTALRDPKVQQGAQLEAEHRNRERTASGHGPMLDYIEVLAGSRVPKCPPVRSLLPQHGFSPAVAR